MICQEKSNVCRIVLFIHLFICFYFYLFSFLQPYYPNMISLMGISARLPQGSQLRQSRATQPTVHPGCLSVSIIHRSPTWTTGPLTCAQMSMHAIARGGVGTHLRKESALKVDPERKIPCRTGESNLCQRRAGPTLYRMSYIPTLPASSLLAIRNYQMVPSSQRIALHASQIDRNH